MPKHSRSIFCITVLLYALHFCPLQAQSAYRLFVFYDVECPICQKYTIRLQNLYKQYGKKVSFRTIYPTKGTTPKAAQAFGREYNFLIPFLIDEAHTIVKKYSATTMPEVVVLKNDEIIYRGAIDNQYVSLGKFRPTPDEFYLKEVLEMISNNQMILSKKTTPVGCLIQD